jgi:hypothetical protein
MLPLPWQHLLPAPSKQLFRGADVVLMQEVFRTPSALVRDPLLRLAATAGTHWAWAAPTPPRPKHCITDSGLAAAGTRGAWAPRVVAFEALPAGRHSDARAHKGVAVFAMACGLRLATTHLQASYNAAHEAADDTLRLAQFGHAVRAAARRRRAAACAVEAARKPSSAAPASPSASRDSARRRASASSSPDDDSAVASVDTAARTCFICPRDSG